MSLPPDEIQAHIEEAVRRYLSKMARRYAPIAAGVIAFVLIVTLVPTVDRASESAQPTLAPGASAPGAIPTGGALPSAVPTAAQYYGVGGSVPPGITAPPPPGTAGVTRSGGRCGPGVRQVTWTVYAPLCEPAYAGNNGGRTSFGVDAKQIVVTYRMANSSEDAAIKAAVGDAYPAPDPVFLKDMQTYIDLFNRSYELWGRKVVLKSFQGQGDFIVEDQGQGQAQAQADAATARSLGAFADATFNLKGSQPYWTGLAQQKVVSIGPLGFPDSYYRTYSPYWWTAYPTGTQQANLLINMVCRRMAGMNAIFAGDAVYRKTKRVFGLLTPENPEYLAIGNQIQSGLKACGVSLKVREKYRINVATMQEQSTTMIAKMHNNDVSMLLCYCDPVIPIFLSNTADSQRYYPEWFQPWYRDPQPRSASQRQMAHTISNGLTWPPTSRSEAYKAFKIQNPRGEPQEQYYEVAYATVLFMFNAFQSAGPDLTPQTFAQGMFSLPRSKTGLYGTWQGRQGQYTSVIDQTLGWWNQTATSGYDGKQGAWISCENSTWFPFDDPSAFGPAGNQLHCFGR